MAINFTPKMLATLLTLPLQKAMDKGKMHSTNQHFNDHLAKYQNCEHPFFKKIKTILESMAKIILTAFTRNSLNILFFFF